MRLVYYAENPAYPGLKNFGDDLNQMVLPPLLPGYFESTDDDVDLLGIGTTLGLFVPPEGPTRRTVVFSSGLGGAGRGAYGAPPRLTPDLDVVCVRGPLTAEAMGLPPSAAVADGALLLRHLFPDDVPIGDRPVFVPHLSTVLSGGDAWRRVCDALGVRYLDPCADDNAEILEAIRAAPLVVAEAMHAAIVAETFGRPWVPVVTNRTINEFKWNDWCRSIGRTYQPIRLPRLVDGAGLGREVGRRARVPQAGAALGGVGAGLVERLTRGRTAQASSTLESILALAPPAPVDRRVVDEKVERLLAGLDEVRRRYPRP